MQSRHSHPIWRVMPIFGLTALLLGALFTVLTFNASAAPDVPTNTAVFFNEIHYDNDGGDVDEAIEIAGPAGTDLTNWSIVLYNGNNGAMYNTTTLTATISDLGNGCGVVHVTYPSNGIQNGAPDGMALVDADNNVIQFLSYEGVFDATDGPAIGMTSVDIGVFEPGTTPVGYSLQLTGSGATYEEFTWVDPMTNTFGAANTGQTFDCGAAVPEILTTNPANGATNVALDATIAITFSEPVTVTADWFDLTCTTSGTITGTTAPVSPADSYTITPSANFEYDEACTVTVWATEVTNSENISLTADYPFTFTTASLTGDITFIYHDLEDVVQAGEAVYIAGDFTSWGTSPLSLTADANFDVFSITVPALTAATYGYKYIVYTDTVPSGPAYWEWLNTNNRSLTVNGDETIHDYRNVVVGWANLQWPYTLTTSMGVATENIYGRLYIENVTNTPGTAGRGLQAHVGYGDDADPANWDWFPMAFQGDDGANNDEFVGVITPTLPGVFSYTTRYDGNWGVGNPNASWTYADINGTPFDPSETGVMTVTFDAVPIAIARAGSNGEVFAVEGQVIYTPGTFNFPGWALQDASGGIGVYFTPPPTVSRGDTVQIIGTRGSFNGEEQFTNASFLNIVGPGPEVVPAPYTTGEIADGSSEGWLAEITGTLLNLNPNDCNSSSDFNFDVDDGTGPAYVFVDRDTGIDLCAYEDGVQISVAGYSTEYNGSYQIKPRDPDDIIVTYVKPIIGKDAPAAVEPGEAFTYTITIENKLGYELTNLVITDVVPADVTVVSVLDGGSETAGVVEWTVASLADQSSADVRFVVTADGEVGDEILNELYAVTAGNFVTPTYGAAVSTSVWGTMPIYTIQGSGDTSPYQGRTLATSGVVVGFFLGNGNYPGGSTFNGFYIQDTSGDGDVATSDGIYIHHGTLSIPVALGDVVTVTGTIQEFNEYNGANCIIADGCLTQIYVTNSSDVTVGPNVALPAPVEINPPMGNKAVGEIYYESLEGMLVTVPVTGVVVGPTNYNTIDIIRGDAGVDRALRGTPYESLPVGVRHYERYGNINGSGANVPSLITGSVIDTVGGPLAFSFGRYIVTSQAGQAWTAITAAPTPAQEPSWPAPAANQFTAATFNTLNFDSGAGSSHFNKVVRSIDQMNGPTFLALQEIDVAGVMGDLITALNGLGYSYEYANSHPDVGDHGVAVMWRTDQVDDVVWSTEYQGCSAYGSSSSVAYDDYCDGTGLWPLFSRRPVVLTATMTISGEQESIIVIGNHFKSKLGGFPSDQRRLEQGELVAGLVDHFVANSTPYVIVMGDLNDFEDAPPLQALYASGNLTTTWNMIAPENRYSYIFEGVSQILDHILISPALWDAVEAVAPLHANADMPYAPFTNDGTVMWHTSDHDLIAATLTIPFTPPVVVTPTVTILTPENGAVYTTTEGTAVTIPVTITTTDFTIPDDGHWHLWVDGTMVGPVLGYTTTLHLDSAGVHTITAELRTSDHVSLGIMDTVTVTVNVEPVTQEIITYLPLVVTQNSAGRSLYQLANDWRAALFD